MNLMRGRTGAASVAVVVAVSATGAATGWLATPAAFAIEPGDVVIRTASGAEQRLNLTELAGQEDVRQESYSMRSAAGDSDEVVTGFSLAKLFAAADIDTVGFSYLQVVRPAGGAIQLSRHQALDPGAFPDGPPVAFPEAGGTGFLRPSSGAGDPNAGDRIAGAAPLEIQLRTGEAIVVDARASAAKVRRGARVTFNATLQSSGAGEQVSYSWYFGDGGTARGSSVSHVFRKPGNFNVVLGATTPGDDVGASDIVSVRVGRERPGPDREGGGAQAHGAAAGPVDGGSGKGSAGTGKGADQAQEAATDPGTAKALAGPPAQAGTEVTGELLSGRVGAVIERERDDQAPGLIAAARAGSPAGDSPTKIPAFVWSLVGGAALLWIGATLEGRSAEWREGRAA